MPARFRFRLALAIVAALLASTSVAAARDAGTIDRPRYPVVNGPIAPGLVPAPTTGTSGEMRGGRSQPGAPGSTRPGSIGTGAAPSNLPGDNPNAPGFPGKVGR